MEKSNRAILTQNEKQSFMQPTVPSVRVTLANCDNFQSVLAPVAQSRVKRPITCVRVHIVNVSVFLNRRSCEQALLQMIGYSRSIRWSDQSSVFLTDIY